MTEKDFCPTCEAAGSAPCVTASGKPAKKRHANRVTVTVDENPVPESIGVISRDKPKFALFSEGRETDKQRFDRVKAQRVAADTVERKRRQAMPIDNSGRRVDPTAPQLVINRAGRRRQGRTNSIGQGRRHRSRMAAANVQVRLHWHPPKVDVDSNVSADA